MFKKNGKKAVAYIALLLTLIMCLGTLLEGAIAFADVDTPDASTPTGETVQDDTPKAEGSTAEDEDQAAAPAENENTNSNASGTTASSEVVTTDKLKMTIAPVSNSLYLNVSGKKKVTVQCELDAAAGYKPQTFDVFDQTKNVAVSTGTKVGSPATIAVEDGHVYCLKVKATDASAKEVILQSKETYSVDFPEKVTDLKATCAKKDNLIKVTWDKVEGANRYYVYRNTKATRPSKPIKTVTGNSFSERRKGGSYYYWVQAANTTDAAASTHVRSGKVTAGKYLTIAVRNYWFTATAKKRIPIYKSAKSKKVIGHLPKGKTVVIKKKSPKVVPQYGVVKRVYFNDKKLKKKGWVNYKSIKLKNHVAGKSNDWSKSVKESYVNKKKFKQLSDLAQQIYPEGVRVQESQ